MLRLALVRASKCLIFTLKATAIKFANRRLNPHWVWPSAFSGNSKVASEISVTPNGYLIHTKSKSFEICSRRSTADKEANMLLVRREIGDVLRELRLQKGHTLRQVAGRASVALGYLSEIERGQKEASSEILYSIAEALDVPISQIMRDVSDRLAAIENVSIPDTVPAEFLISYTSQVQSVSN
jgi:transcriptional regulator with XRE-family HTH domain